MVDSIINLVVGSHTSMMHAVAGKKIVCDWIIDYIFQT